MTDRDTGRWRGITAVAFLAGAVGILTNRPAAFLVAVVGVAYAAYAEGSAHSSPSVAVERTVEADDPEPGDEVEVTVEVENEGDLLLPDLRIVDGVPAAVEVVDGSGSPRLATALRPGKRARFSYAVEARRGTHEFDPATVVARDASGARETETTVAADGTLACVPRLTDLGAEFPLRGQTVQYAGRVTTDSGGSGVEFHATRAYRTGDPLSRVDWSRLAKTGDLTTVEFREEQAATVVLVVDSRTEAYVADPDGTSAVEYGVGAAGAVAAALLDSGDRVGVASLGPQWSWQGPGLGRVHRRRLRRSLALDRGFDPAPSTERFLPGLALRRLRKHLPADAQVVLFSPATDDYVGVAARRLEAFGHAVTLVSPDVTGADTPGNRLANLERDRRLREVRSADVRVVDWPVDRPLAAAVADARRGWRR